jgi:hypothetical protein
MMMKPIFAVGVTDAKIELELPETEPATVEAPNCATPKTVVIGLPDIPNQDGAEVAVLGYEDANDHAVNGDNNGNNDTIYITAVRIAI